MISSAAKRGGGLTACARGVRAGAVFAVLLALEGCGGGGPLYGVGGTISGLGNSNGLVLLNNGGDPTIISAGATSFTMNTLVAAGSSYAISVGTQPYGISIGCTISNASGTVITDVTAVAVNCAPVTPVKKTIAWCYHNPVAVAVDRTGNLFVVEGGPSSVIKIPFRSGSYGTANTLATQTDLIYPAGIAVDGTGNVFVSDIASYDVGASSVVRQIPFSGGSYGTPIVIPALGRGATPGIAMDATDNIFVGGEEIPFRGGTYGVPTYLGLGGAFYLGFNTLSMDGAGNLFFYNVLFSNDFATRTNEVVEYSYGNGSYGAPVSIGSGFAYITGLTVDEAGNVFLDEMGDDSGSLTIQKIPLGDGGYGIPVAVGTITTSNVYVPESNPAVDAAGDVFVADSADNTVKEIPFSNGRYGMPTAVESSISAPPRAVAIDAVGNVYLIDASNVIKEIPFNNDVYATPITISSSFTIPTALATDAAGDVFVADSGNHTVVEIPSCSSGCGTPIAVAAGVELGYNSNLAIDAAQNLFFVSLGAVMELPFNGDIYAAPITIGSGFSTPERVEVDAGGNVFVADAGIACNGVFCMEHPIPTVPATVYEIPLVNGSYGAPINLGLSAPPGSLQDLVVDAADDIFVLNGEVEEFPFENGSYGTPMVAESSSSEPSALALDAQGRLYIVDADGIEQFAP